MSSRFLKKVEETYGHKAKIVENSDEYESSEEESVPNFSNKFDLLQIESESDEEEVVNNEECELKGDLKKNAGHKKGAKSKKAKSNKQSDISKFEEMTEDEILDQYRSEFEHSETQVKNDRLCNVMAIKYRNLNEKMELQQMFGPTAAGTTASTGHGRRNNHAPLLKFLFGKRGSDWPQVSVGKLGLTMTEVDENKSKDNWCVVTCSDEYIRGERALKTVMRTGDYQDHMRQWPYHVNTLLQMAMLLINQEDFTLAADILKRIFFVYDSISPIGASLLDNCSLDYKYRMNRGIFIALFQFIHYLCQRSCFNTALEYCKVILKLNIINDPLAMVLMIDDIAIRGNQFDFVIQFYQQFQSTKSLQYLPNFAFSLSLCHFLKSSAAKSQPADLAEADLLLQQALCRFPSFLMSFIDQCSIATDDRLSASLFFTRDTDSVPLSLLVKLYIKRSVNLWKNTSVLKWVESNVQRLLGRFESEEMNSIDQDRQHVLDIYKRVIPLAIKRHIFLSGHSELLDPNEQNMMSLIFDPFPPANSVGGFDHYSETDSPVELDDSWLINLFRSLMPSFR